MSTKAWCLVQDLVRQAPPLGRRSDKCRAREEWLLDKLRETSAELLDLRETTQGILDEHEADDIEKLVEELVDEREEHATDLHKANGELDKLRGVGSDYDALQAKHDALQAKHDQWRKRAHVAEAALEKGSVA